MKKSKFYILLVILPLLFSCSKLQPLTKDDGVKQSVVNLPENTEFAKEVSEINEKNNFVVTFDRNYFHIGKEPYGLDLIPKKAKEFFENDTSNDETTYLQVELEVEYGNQLVEFFQKMREVGLTEYKLIVKRKGDSEKNIGGFDIKIQNEETNDSQEKPNPLTLILTVSKDSKIHLNKTLIKQNEIKDKFVEIFKSHEDNGVFKPGTNNIEKTVYLKPSKYNKYGNIIEIIDALTGAGASPIILVIDDLD